MIAGRFHFWSSFSTRATSSGTSTPTAFPAVFEPAQLLELLDALEFTLRQRGIFEQGIALENIQAEMLQVAHLNFAYGIPHPRNRRARKIKRIAIEVQHRLHHVGIHDVGGSLDGCGHRANRGCRFLQQGRDGRIHGNGIKKRLIALDVHEDFAFFVGGHFRNALRAGAVIRAGHARFAAEFFNGLHNALVVGGHEDAIRASGQLRLLVHALNHGLPRERHQRLSRQARGRITRRDDHNNFDRTHSLRVLQSGNKPRFFKVFASEVLPCGDATTCSNPNLSMQVWQYHG